MWYFSFSVGILALLLFFPLSRLIWVLSVRRLQRRRAMETSSSRGTATMPPQPIEPPAADRTAPDWTAQALSPAEIAGQLNRARFLAVFVSLAFSFLFNLQLLGWPGHG